MDDYEIVYDRGDQVDVVTDPNDADYLAIRIENKAFLEPIRWLRFAREHGHDRERDINALIDSLTQLREQTRRAIDAQV